MSASLDAELKALLAFYGETADGPEATKPEEFFGMILSFSSSLQASGISVNLDMLLTIKQKAALEVHDSEVRSRPPTPKVSVEEQDPATPTETVSSPPMLYCSRLPFSLLVQTVKGIKVNSDNTLKPPPDSQGRAAGRSIGRGDLDNAIRSMRDGRRRERPQRPLSKIFVDGVRSSRLYE